MECLLPYLCMVTVPHIMVGLERMLDYRGVGLERFHCIGFTISTESNSTFLFQTKMNLAPNYCCFHVLQVSSNVHRRGVPGDVVAKVTCCLVL